MPNDEYPIYEPGEDPEDLPWELRDAELPPEAQGAVWCVVIEHHVQPISSTAIDRRQHRARVVETDDRFEDRGEASRHARRLAFEYIPPRLANRGMRRIYRDGDGFLVVLTGEKEHHTQHFTARVVRLIGVVPE